MPRFSPLRRFFFSTRVQLMASFLVVSFLVGGLSAIVGGHLLYNAFLNEAMSRIRMDLTSARELYDNRVKQIEIALTITTLGSGFRDDVEQRNLGDLRSRLKRLASYTDLDFAGIVLNDGTTLCRLPSCSDQPEPPERANPIARMVLGRDGGLSGTFVLSPEDLAYEDPALADRARIALVATPRAAPDRVTEERSGMTIASAIPICVGERCLGVLYGGVLLNRSTAIVDRMRDAVFQQETYEGQSVGTATIFLHDVRVSTNVLTATDERATGTRVSAEVRQQVLGEGRIWLDRAFVVHDWYMTAYERIVDVRGEPVGMIYVGVLESWYTSVQRNTLLIFFVTTALGITLAVILAYFLENLILGPVRRIIDAAVKVSKGEFDIDLGPRSQSEVGVLQHTFSEMIASLRERDERLQAESDDKLLKSEREAAVGRLAAGVAHEINNPLTGVMTYSHMLLRRKDLSEEVRADLQTIATQTQRVRKIVKGLLDFSRQTRLDPELIDINRLVRSTTSLIDNQALVKGVALELQLSTHLPQAVVDRNQLESVLLNIVLNALDATEAGDKITISTSTTVSGGSSDQRGVEIEVEDTGCGIPPEHLDSLFTPFFTTKEVGKGTGLGLAVSYGIVQRHGGEIRVKSVVGKGSTFSILLPVHDHVPEEHDENEGAHRG